MKNPTHNALKFLAIIIWVVFVVMLITLFRLLFQSNSEKEKLFGIFSIHNNEIYASVPSNGDYKIPEADKSSFQAISENRKDRHVANDHNYVYCGNLILPNLKPSSVVSLGYNYYSDGTLTYYCAPYSEKKDSLNTIEELWQTLLFINGFGAKPQTYSYPFRQLPKTTSPYYTLQQLDSFSPIITDGTSTFYKGKLMPNANPKTLKEVPFQKGETYRNKSYKYFLDGFHLYFENKQLPTSYYSTMYAFQLEAQNTKEYLISPSNGMVYVDSLSFPQKDAPFELISRHSAHVYHTLFKSPAGIYYYDQLTKEIYRIGDNPFQSSNFNEIAPLIFYDGWQTIFIDEIERWKGKNYRTGGGGGLASRSTIIYQLDENLSAEWKKVSTLQSGTLWKNGSKYFYFDEYGNSQLIHHTIYKIPS